MDSSQQLSRECAGLLLWTSTAQLVPLILTLSALWAELLLGYMELANADDHYWVLPLPIMHVSFIIIHKYVHINVYSIGSVPLENAD